MIGFLEKPTGRMGNVLIQYVFLRQLAERIGTDYFHVSMPYEEFFEEFEKKNLSWRVRLSKKWIVTNSMIAKLGMERFISEAQEYVKNGYLIILKPPVLGHLFEFKDENPGKFIKIKEKYIQPLNTDFDVLVGIHFRGTDFKEWNEKALLPFDYYKKAIDSLLSELDSKKIRIELFTDDNQFMSYQKTCDYIKTLDYEGSVSFGNAMNSMITDFYRLSQCDYIISSPSTFAIVAGIVGKKDKRIIHAKQWVDFCVEKKEKFWVDVSERKVPYYQIEDIL